MNSVSQSRSGGGNRLLTTEKFYIQVGEIPDLRANTIHSTTNGPPIFDFGLQSESAITIKAIAEPATPASGYAVKWLDSSDGNYKIKFDDGSVVTIATAP